LKLCGPSARLLIGGRRKNRGASASTTWIERVRLRFPAFWAEVVKGAVPAGIAKWADD
jgi:hypothetical protein